MFKVNQGNWDTEEEQQKLREFLLALRGHNLGTVSGSESTECPQITVLPPDLEEKMDSYRGFWVTREGLFELRSQIRPYIIRRDNRSVDWKGRPLLGLLPLIEITSYLVLDEATTEALKSQQEGRDTQ
jgi:hypothetical protein